MNYLMTVVQALEYSSILLKGDTKTIKNKIKDQKEGFLSVPLGTLGTSLSGNLLSRNGTVRAGERILRVAYASSIKKKKALISPHLLTNFELKEHFENEPKLNGVCITDNLSKTIKNVVYVINLDE